MVSWLGHIRRISLTPDVNQALLRKRGFPERDPQAKACLEMAGRSFIEGFGVAAQSSTAVEATATLARIDGIRRGFAFEGAAMAMAIRDALPLGHRHHVADLLEAADDHIYMIHVGVGWSLARLPRPLRRAATVGLTDPTLTWLALDGYGFHQAFFHTDKYVRRQYIDPAPPLPMGAHAGYAPRAIDQGIGRALWFVAGADPNRALRLIEAFPPQRHEDLFAGLGLATTYAGGASRDEIEELAKRVGRHRPALAQGSVFAAEARTHAHITQPHTENAVQAITGLHVTEAAAIATQTRPSGHTVDGQLSFEVWRRRIMQRWATEARFSLDPPLHSSAQSRAAVGDGGNVSAAAETDSLSKPRQPGIDRAKGGS
ncbi:DUF1702 family protein [Streptomyces spectabilis]|uniref:DUF1702 family protein n=1 Tax=Streptomyces spectabilis TaxID=68270 RepID=A0A5P2WYK7_STRST|nr:DUF1702 family protein [Streptomyces spectabilis]QEV57843.1 DUF1702 family protein [Streptomyces spectabilis]GGV09030.1 enediyne biosynthesis protein [Streptomyces spectabilis]